MSLHPPQRVRSLAARSVIGGRNDQRVSVLVWIPLTRDVQLRRQRLDLTRAQAGPLMAFARVELIRPTVPVVLQATCFSFSHSRDCCALRDGAGVSVSEAALSIGEGSSETYSIVLDSLPTADVTVTINDPADNADVTASPASLSFTADDWSTAQTVTVDAAQDADAVDETATVTHTVSSSDSSYQGATANSVTVSVTDDDDVAVTVSYEADTYTVAEGDTVTVTVTLDADPERTVVIPLTATPQGSTTAADYSVSATSVTFNAGDVSETFTVTATDDAIDDDSESVLLGFGASLPDRVSAGATATVSISDDDAAGVSVSAATLDIEEGGTGTYTVVLESEPTAAVTVTINDPADNADVTASPASLTFTADDWSTAQTVTVEAAQDIAPAIVMAISKRTTIRRFLEILAVTHSGNTTYCSTQRSNSSVK